MLTMNGLIAFGVVLMPVALFCYMALKGRPTKDEQELERAILEVVNEQPDILAAALEAEVRQRLNRSIHLGRLHKTINDLLAQGFLCTTMKMGLDLAGERRRLPYLQLTSAGEQRLLVTA